MPLAAIDAQVVDAVRLGVGDAVAVAWTPVRQGGEHKREGESWCVSRLSQTR